MEQQPGDNHNGGIVAGPVENRIGAAAAVVEFLLKTHKNQIIVAKIKIYSWRRLTRSLILFKAVGGGGNKYIYLIKILLLISQSGWF